MNSTIYPSGVDDAKKFLCARTECVNPRTEASGLCLSCELRFNTTQEKFEQRLEQLLRQERPSRGQLELFFWERKRLGR